MGRKLSAVYDEEVVAEIERLASEHGLTEQEVLRQLVYLGLDSR
ncbi:hypothetical protein U3A55_05300 [Salarchaeum sp. III]